MRMGLRSTALAALLALGGCGNGTIAPACTSAADCHGQVCKAGACAPCVDGTDDALCGMGRICVVGQCTAGTCHDAGGCAGGQVCKGAMCTACTDGTDDALCGMGKICVNGACAGGACHDASGCTGGQLCKANQCAPCVDGADDAACGMGRICVAGACTAGDCHADGDCLGQLCRQHVCTPCTDRVDDAACGMGKICVAGSCVAGDCHDAADCADGQRCVVNGCTPFGSGSDGPLTVAANTSVAFESLTNTTAVTKIAGADVTAAAPMGFLEGDDVLLINLQGTRVDAGSTGNYEFATVTGIAGPVLTLAPPPARAYGNNGGNADLTGQKVFLVRVPNFTDVTVAGTLTADAWAGNAGALGLVVFRANGKVTVMPGGQINLSSLGYYGVDTSENGVSGTAGEAAMPLPPKNCFEDPASCPNGGGGGGGVSNCDTYSCTAQQLGAAGGGGGYGTAGAAGAANGNLHTGGKPGLTYGQAELTQIFLGAGGGGGAGGMNGPGNGTHGGRGGGLLYVVAPTIAVAGAIAANGQVGATNNNCGFSNGSGSGGGGAGGSLHLRAQAVTLANTTAVGGPASCKGGGAGGVGRIRVDYATLNGAAFPNGNPSVTSPAAYLGAAP